MALSINTLRSEVYKYLNESSASTLGQVPDGVGGTTTSSDNVVKDWILEGINALCRSCVFYPVVGTYTLTNATYTVDISTPSSISPASSALWFPTDVYIGSRRLTHASEQSIRANNLSYKTTAATATSDILYWYRSDNYKLSVYPLNNTANSVTLTVQGAGTPPPPASDATASIDILPDDLLKQLIGSYVASLLVMKNTDDPSIAQRAFWQNQYDAKRMQLWARMDPHMKQTFAPFSIPPVQMETGR
jgi:hypothetical protein